MVVYFILTDSESNEFIYRGVGQTRTMDIAKKSSELAQLVRVSPTMPVKSFWGDMEFLIYHIA